MATRILAIFAALLLVGAFAVATLGPNNMSLGQALYLLDASMLHAVQDFLRGHRMGGVWDRLALPMLVRPAWLIPAALGLICIGGAATASSGNGAPRSHPRRRS